MRTVVFIGLMSIGGSLRHIAGLDAPNTGSTFFIGIIFCLSLTMDLLEFNKKISK